MWNMTVEINEPMKHTLPNVLRQIADTMEERSNQRSETRTEEDGANRTWEIEEVPDPETGS